MKTIAALTICGAIVCLAATVPAYAFEAGAARVDITPPLGTPLCGYADRLGRGALDVHDPVYARCLYLNDGDTPIVWVAADLCAITPKLRQRVLELAPPQIPKENVILSATHTHNAQGGMVEKPLLARYVSGRFVPEVLEATAIKFAEAMKVAHDSRRPASIGYAISNDPAALAELNMAKASIDAQLAVIRVDDADGNPIAILTNLAAHPTTVRSEHRLSVSADFPGFLCSSLESSIPGCTAMFANGAQGDQRPVEGTQKGWEWTEAIGASLANNVKTLADTVRCTEANLHVANALPRLPASMAADILPSQTVLQTLEIDDLLLEFVPGEACADVGLELRTHALERGYAAQCTIGLSNDHIGYIVTAQAYGNVDYETRMSFYGPRMTQWLTSEFGKLMTRGAADAPPSEIVAPDTDAAIITLSGTPYEIGYQRGLAQRDHIVQEYENQILTPVKAGLLVPKSLKVDLSDWLDLSAYAVPMLGIEARAWLEGASADTINEVSGMADAVGLPFDAVWLAQCSQFLAPQLDMEPLTVPGTGIMCASIGDRAGTAGAMAGCLLEVSESPVIVDVTPIEGLRYAYIGSLWKTETFCGMNERGVVVCAERIVTYTDADGLPIGLFLRDVLKSAKTADQALTRVKEYTHQYGYRILIAAPKSVMEHPTAYVVELGKKPVVRKPSKGFILGAPLESQPEDSRYAQLHKILGNEHIISASKAKRAFEQCVGDTCFMAVFEPKSRSIEVAFPNEQGDVEGYMTVILKDSANE